MRSAVPLPCFFDVIKSQKVAGQRPQQGTVEWGEIPSIRPPAHLSVPYFGKVGLEPKSLAQLILGQYDGGKYSNGAYRCSQNIPHLAQS